MLQVGKRDEGNRLICLILFSVAVICIAKDVNNIVIAIFLFGPLDNSGQDTTFNTPQLSHASCSPYRSRKPMSFEKKIQNFEVSSECFFLTSVREENNVTFVIKVGFTYWTS